MKRLTALFIALLLCLPLATLPAYASGSPVEIEIWHIYPADESADLMTALLNEFMAQNPNVKVTDLGITFWDYDPKLQPALAAGTGTDIFINDLGNVGGRANSGMIMNLQKLAEEKNFDTSVFLPASLNQCTFEGDLFAFPFITDTRVLYWNKDHFAAVGLDPETPPTTWAQMIEFNDKLTTFKDEAKIEVDRMGFSSTLGNFYQWTMAWTYGAELFNADKTPNFTSPEAIEALNTALVIQGQVGIDAMNAYTEGTKGLGYSPFIGGTLSMVVETNNLPWQIAKYAPDLNYGVAMIPTNDGVNNFASWGNGFSLEMVDKGADRVNAAFDLGMFLTNKDSAMQWIDVTNAFVCNQVALTDPTLTTNPIWEIMVKSGEVTKFRNFVLEYPTWYGPFTTEWNNALRGEKTPEQAMADANDTVVQEIDNYRVMNGL